MSYEDIYGFVNKEVLSFAMNNEFTQRMNKGAYSLGQSLQPFCFFADEKAKEAEVVDVATFGGFAGTGKSLLEEVAEYRKESYENFTGMPLPISDEINKTLFIDYLLSVSACYIEYPKTSRTGKVTIQKGFATRNSTIMSMWTGLRINEVNALYTSKIAQTNVDIVRGELNAVMLKYGSKGNSLEVNKYSISTKDVVCVPLFMLYAFQVGFYPKLENSILKFTFVKDNGAIRELPTTLNPAILFDYYKGCNSFVSNAIGMVDIFTITQGNMQFSSKLNRGYIKVFELGGSQYDKTGVRSINVARLLKIEELTEVDRTFIDVELDKVVESFFEGTMEACTVNPMVVIDIYKALVGDAQIVEENDNAYEVSCKLQEFVNTYNNFFTTEFRRELHIFMVEHPEWFKNYTGKRIISSNVLDSSKFTVEKMDF